MRNSTKGGFSLTEMIIVLAVSSISVIAILIIYSSSIRETERIRAKTDELGVISRIDLILQKELIKAGPESAYIKQVTQSNRVVGIRYKVDIPLNRHNLTKQIYFKNSAVYVWEKDFSVADFAPGSLSNLEPTGSSIVLSTQEYPGMEIRFNLKISEIEYNLAYKGSVHTSIVSLLSTK